MDYLTQAKKLYQGKKVLILGLGINQGGLGATKFFAKAGSKVKVTDLKTKEDLQSSIDELINFEEIEYTLGEHRYEDIDWADIVVRNPGVKPDNPYLLYAIQHKKKVEMDLSILLNFIEPEKIIGITGTKGKSTTSSLIYKALLENGLEIIFAGNIGKSMLDCVPHLTEKTFLVLELSSFQLQALEPLKISPKYSVITNIFPDHLNYHHTMESYIEAKLLITKFQTKSDFLFLNKDNEITSDPEFVRDLKAKIIYFSMKDLPSKVETQLPGEHNLENIACAVEIAKVFGITQHQTLESIKDFSGVEFRLQLIKDLNGIKIYNDSAATNPQAAIEALKSLPNSVVICGGMNKNLEYLEMAKVLDEKAKQIYFIEGDATEEIKKYLVKTDLVKGEYDNLEGLLKDVLANSQKGDNILFSPGATSFNFWKNEFDRGRNFNRAVEKLIS